MTVHMPMFYGAIVRKNAKTHDYVSRCNTRHHERHPGVPQNEDSHLLAVSLAMSRDDSDSAAEAFERMGWVRGEDFVLTDAVDGLRDPVPAWLNEFEFIPPTVITEPHPIRPIGPHLAYRAASA